MRLPLFGDEWKAADEAGRPSVLQRGKKDFLFTEQFKTLRAKFEYKVDMLNYRVVAVTSSIAGEGKTVSSSNLAINLASAGRKKVLLVDMDLRKSDLARVMGIDQYPGLSEYLSGTVALENILRNYAVRGLSLITAGSRISASADLIAGDKFRSLLKDLRNRFDVILLDTPPIIPVADTLFLRDQVDGFVFLFRTGYTPYTLLRQAVEEIGSKNVIGVVLNGVEPQKEKYYQRYYGKYYRKKSDKATES